MYVCMLAYVYVNIHVLKYNLYTKTRCAVAGKLCLLLCIILDMYEDIFRWKHAGVTLDLVPPKVVRVANKSIPRVENTSRTDPRGLNKSIPHRVNRSAGDQNVQA